jgi:hypothetical protein
MKHLNVPSIGIDMYQHIAILFQEMHDCLKQNKLLCDLATTAEELTGHSVEVGDWHYTVIQQDGGFSHSKAVPITCCVPSVT